MKVKHGMLAAAISLLAFANPVGLAAQATQTQPHLHHHYQLRDLGTFGGPNSNVNIEPFQPALNNAGTVVGFADTSIPTLAPNCYNPVFNPDCDVSHAFVWRDGQLKDLGTLPGGSEFSFGAAINQLGQIAGTSETGQIDPASGNPEFHAVKWQHGNILDLGALGGVSSYAADINDSGQVIGAALNNVPDSYSMLGLGSGTTMTQTRGFLWEHGAMKDLGTLGGPDSWPVFVNDRGQVAGTSYTSDSIDPNTGLPPVGVFLWENGKMKDLGNLGGDNGLLGSCSSNLPCIAFPNIVFGLNNRGQVTGNMEMPGNQTVHAFLWDGEKLDDLGTLGGSASFAERLNDKGEVVGNSWTAGDNALHSFVTMNGAMIDLGTTGDFECNVALGINESSQIVGALTSAVDGCGAWRSAFLWENGGMVDLNTLIPSGSSLKLAAAFDVNDRGEIVGQGMDPVCSDSDTCDFLHAYLLIPCDELHPNLQGCDYSLVEADTEPEALMTAKSPIAIRSLHQFSANRYHVPLLRSPKE